jgi:hypothetical protein
MAGNIDYPRVFNRLAHTLAISQQGKLNEAVDNLILTALTLSCEVRSVKRNEIGEVIQTCFGLTLNDDLLRSSVDRLMTKGELLQDPPSKHLLVSPSARASIEVRIEDAQVLEVRVKTEWLESVAHTSNEECRAELWACLSAYMARAFQRHGAQTIMLLSPNVPLREENRKQLSIYMEEAIHETCAQIPHDVALDAVQQFFRKSTPLRTKYVTQLLDGTFTYFALTVDRATSVYLRDTISPLTLFLDTNFIFGVLDLHSHPLNEVSQQLVAFIKKNQLPFKLLYHEATFKEFERTLDALASRLKGTKWQPSVSRVAVRSGRLSGVELRYHELNAQAPLDPDVFLSKYAYLPELLDDWGFQIFKPSSETKQQTDERHRLVAEYGDHVERHRKLGPKPYDALNHDITVWQTVRRMRSNGSSVFHVGAFFLTTDYYFYSFDWQNLRQPKALGITVLPDQFFQLLRPFVPSTDDSNHGFVETFAIPEFRTVATDYTATVGRVLSFLNTYADVSEDTAVKILANEVLIEQLKGLDETSREFAALIENAFVEDNERLRREKEELASQAQVAQQKTAEIELIAQQKDDELRRLKEEHDLVLAEAASTQERQAQELQATQNFLAGTASRLRDEQARVETIQRELDRRKVVGRYVLAALLAILGIGAIVVLPSVFRWGWLEQHPARLGLYLASILVILGIAWAIADSKHRKTAIPTLIVGAVLVIAQIIGR